MISYVNINSIKERSYELQQQCLELKTSALLASKQENFESSTKK